MKTYFWLSLYFNFLYSLFSTCGSSYKQPGLLFKILRVTLFVIVWVVLLYDLPCLVMKRNILKVNNLLGGISVKIVYSIATTSSKTSNNTVLLYKIEKLNNYALRSAISVWEYNDKATVIDIFIQCLPLFILWILCIFAVVGQLLLLKKCNHLFSSFLFLVGKSLNLLILTKLMVKLK